MKIFKKIDITGKFTFGLLVSMSITFLLSGAVVLQQQSTALNNLLQSSNQTTRSMFEKNSIDAKAALVKKIKNLSLILAAISPEPISESAISTIYNYAQQVQKDNDISYVAIYDSNGILLNIAGDKSLIKKGPYIAQDVTVDEFKLGEIIIGYSYDQLNKKLAAAEALNSSNLRNMEIARDSAMRQSTISLTVAIVICATVIALTLLWMFRLMIVNRLKVLETNMRDIAEGEGDLTHRITVKGHDGIDRLGNYFNLFLTKIHQTISQVNDATIQIKTASSQMTSITEETTDAINAQQVKTEQVATAINQMAATVTEVARSATEAASAAKEADSQSSDGQHVVKTSIDYIRQLAGDVESAATVIETLKSDSESIGGVLDVIQGIAEQTNLLALNAAIEAARAGEQGRGFAVVADEVRTLAQRTQESTTEIKEMIDRLQHGAENAVTVMSKGREQAQKSVDKANETGNSLEAITAAVATINLMNTQIASAAEQQNAVAEDINKNITSISDHGEKTSHGANQTALASAELNSLSSGLSVLMQKFKI